MPSRSGDGTQACPGDVMEGGGWTLAYGWEDVHVRGCGCGCGHGCTMWAWCVSRQRKEISKLLYSPVSQIKEPLAIVIIICNDGGWFA